MQRMALTWFKKKLKTINILIVRITFQIPILTATIQKTSVKIANNSNSQNTELIKWSLDISNQFH